MGNPNLNYCLVMMIRLNIAQIAAELTLKELNQRLKKRIEVTSKMATDSGHGQRQEAEQDLIKSIEKFLGQYYMKSVKEILEILLEELITKI